MENFQEGLVSWALNEFNENIVLFEQSWNFFETQPYYDFRTIIKIDNVEYEGRGVSKSQRQSLTSSVAEAIERFAIGINKNKYSSNGCAIHSLREIAILNSRRELIERHYVMLFSLGYFNGNIISTNDIPLEINDLINNLENKNIEVVFYKLISKMCESVVLCQISGLNSESAFGVTFGSSCKSSTRECIENSFCEALPNAIAFLNGNILPINLESFKKIAKPAPLDHLSLYLNKDFAIDYLKNRVLQPFTNEESLDEKLFKTEEITYPYSHLFPVVRTTHPDCIDAKWGFLPQNSTPNNLNPLFPLVLP